MDNNILLKILVDYPDSWKDTKRFKALLLDFLPEDKRLRNLIVISIEERIPDDIFQSKSRDSLQENAYVKRLVNAVGCSNDDARSIVELWVSAILHIGCTDIIENDKEPLFENLKDLLIEKLELPTSAYYPLKRAGIERVSDLIKMSEEDILTIRGCGRKTVGFIQDRLSTLGYSLKKTDAEEKHMDLVRDDVESLEIDQKKMDRIKFRLMQLAVDNKTAKRSKHECAQILSHIVEKELFDN